MRRNSVLSHPVQPVSAYQTYKCLLGTLTPASIPRLYQSPTARKQQHFEVWTKERKKHGWRHTPSQARLEEHFISGNNEIIRVVMDMCVVILWCCVEYVFCVGARIFWFGPMRNEEKIKIKPKTQPWFLYCWPRCSCPCCQVLTLRWRNSIQLNSRNAHFFCFRFFFLFVVVYALIFILINLFGGNLVYRNCGKCASVVALVYSRDWFKLYTSFKKKQK